MTKPSRKQAGRTEGKSLRKKDSVSPLKERRDTTVCENCEAVLFYHEADLVTYPDVDVCADKTLCERRLSIPEEYRSTLHRGSVFDPIPFPNCENR